MTNSEASPPAAASAPDARLQSGPVSRAETAVSAAVVVGCLCAFTGLAAGLKMAFKRKEATCPNGKFFPEGTTDFRCFAHPHALDGTAVVVFSLMLGILIVLTGVIARAAVTPAYRPDVADTSAGPRP